jgi:hypothetical protein
MNRDIWSRPVRPAQAVETLRRPGLIGEQGCRLVVLVLLLLFWTVSLDYLSVFPPVGQDEPWIAAAAYKLATESVFGSDLFAGYYGMELHHYQHLPAFHLLQAGLFRLAGVGVFQMRLLSVVFGLLLLTLTFAVRRQVDSAPVGLSAVALLLGLRLVNWGDNSGVPLLDIARINRYDIAVPVYGLAAFWAFNRRRFFASGLLVGVSGLNHMYGLFWLPAFGLLLALREGWVVPRRRAGYLLLAGTILPWLPWLVYVATGWHDFLGQQRFVASRFEVFDLRFYLDNLLHEIDRYRMLDLLDEQGRLQFRRPGLWTALLVLPPAIFGLLLSERRTPPFALAVVLVVQSLLFGLLLAQKHFNYMIALWPLAVLVLARAIASMWGRLQWPMARLFVVAAFVLILFEGGLNVARRHWVAARTSAYDAFIAQIAATIPDGAMILGLPHYWLGLRDYPYRTWLLPLLRSDPAFHHDPLTLTQALDTINPEVVLLDGHMRDCFVADGTPVAARHCDYAQFRHYMREHQARLSGGVDDPDYGRVEVYRLQHVRY